MVCSASYLIVGVLTKAQPFSSDSMFDKTSSALTVRLVSALLALADALVTERIYSLKLRHKSNFNVITVAILTIILCIYTGLVITYALSNAERYEWRNWSSVNYYKGCSNKEIFIVSIISNIFTGLLSIIWLGVIYISSVKLFGSPQSS